MKKDFKINSFTGLSDQEAEQRLKKEGPNELPASKKRSFWAITVEVVSEPMFLMLVACGVLYLFIGDMEEALMLWALSLLSWGLRFIRKEKPNERWKPCVTFPALARGLSGRTAKTNCRL